MLISFGSGNWSWTIPILRQEQFCRGEPFHDTSSAYVWRVTGVRTYLFQSVTRWAWLSWMKFQWLHLLSNSKQTLILENRIRKLYWHGQLTCLKRAENKTLETILKAPLPAFDQWRKLWHICKQGKIVPFDSQVYPGVSLPAAKWRSNWR